MSTLIDLSHAQKFRAYLELVRVSNLPTVLSNTLVGAVIGQQSAGWAYGAIAAVCASIACFYMAGMALNDLVDLPFDRTSNPDRPLPSGRIDPNTALAFVVVLIAVGLIILTLFAASSLPWAGALVLATVGYDLIHKRWSGAVLLMGVCRGLVYMTAASAMTGVWEGGIVRHLAAPFAVLLGLYTVGITVVARVEHLGGLDARRWLSPVMIAIPLAALFVPPPETVPWAAAVGGLMVLWLVRACWFVFQKPPGVKNAVLTWLAGMALVDAFFLSVLGEPYAALVAVVCFAVTAWGHRRIQGT